MIGSDLKVSPVQFSFAIEELSRLVQIPSVSHPKSPYYSMATLAEAAEFVKSRLEGLNFKARCLSVKGSAPYVIAERIVDISKPTLLLYAHYDVQPVDESQWETKPFLMTERDGRLYGRGASDDKAGLITILTALRVYEEQGVELPVNIKILSEGEEEYGSSHMSDLLSEEATNLQAHVMIVLDALNKDVSTGTLTTATRGIVNLSMEVKALKQPKHSGLACLAPCPALALAVLISSLQHPEKIPGFMDDVQQMPDQERVIYQQCSQTPESYLSEMGVMKGGTLRGDPNLSVYERIVETPSISIVNMKAGEPNGGNSIQDSASCTIGIRTTAGQDPNRVGQIVAKYLKEQPVPGNLPIEVKVLEGSHAWKADITRPFSKKYMESLRENFKDFCTMPCGGSLPLLYEIQTTFAKKGFSDIEIICPGMEDPETNAHSHNESQSKEVLENSINTLISFINKAADMQVNT